MRSMHRLPTVESRGSMSGRAGLAPASVVLAFMVIVGVVAGAAGAALDVSGGPVGGLTGVLAFFVADQWYVFGARRLGLLPATAAE